MLLLQIIFQIIFCKLHIRKSDKFVYVFWLVINLIRLIDSYNEIVTTREIINFFRFIRK